MPGFAARTSKPLAFERAGAVPVRCRITGKAEEAPVIVGIADQDLWQGRTLFGRAIGNGGQRRQHQRLAEPFALPLGQYRDRSDHQERMRTALGIDQTDGPQLDRGDQIFVIVQRGEAERGQPVHPRPDAIGGAGVALRTEGAVEQCFDHIRCYRFEGDDGWQSAGRSGAYAQVFGTSRNSLPPSPSSST